LHLPLCIPAEPGRQTGRGRAEAGMALVSVLLVMMLMSALLVGFFAMIAADQQSSGVNRDQTQAYAAAHAGLEKLTADLGALFTGGNYSPTTAQLNALASAPPTLPGFQFIAPSGGSGYTITPQTTVVATIPNGAFQGLQGLLTPYEVNVTARATGGVVGGAAEVRMRRVVQTVAVPVFQFGMYSENDLSFFAGPDFDFGGRVHSNQNIYLAQDGSAALTLRDMVTAVGEIVRTHLANGLSISTSGHRGYVRVATTGGSNPAFKCLSCGAMGGNCQGTPPSGTCTSSTSTSVQEGSVTVASVPPSTLQMVGTPPVPTMVLATGNTTNEPRWTNVSTGTFSNRIRNGRTGAKRLDLPLVSDGALPIDLVRRPSIASPDPQVVLDQRYFKMASVRILLSDRAGDITGLQTVTNTAPINLARLAIDATYRATVGITSWNIPLALAGTYAATNGYGYRLPLNAPIIDGYLKIEFQNRTGDWTDVTAEILNLGFTARNIANNGTWNTQGTTCAAGATNDPSPGSVIRLQRVRDNPSAGFTNCGHSAANVWSTLPTDYIPLTLYDAREGARRDDEAGAGNVPLFGGVMHYVELDVNNLRVWMATHADMMDVTGYVLYFSDRRGNKNLGGDMAASPREGADNILYNDDDFGTDDQETGELGFEDIINPTSAQSVSNGVLDTGEDVNGNGTLDVYGGTPRQYPGALAPFTNGGVVTTATSGASGYWASGAAVTLTTPVSTTYALGANDARVNPPIFFRRALKIVNGGYTTGTVSLKLPHNGSQGLSVVAENGIYVQGNYNAPNAAGNDFGTVPGTDHVSAAVIGDAVTLLSNDYNDIVTFGLITAGTPSPHVVAQRQAPNNTWYRMAVISGKGLNFPKPTSNTEDHTDFGTDGGAHNFLRYIEKWDGTLNYRGSIVSFFLNRQQVGIYKCCDVVYDPPTRGYKFDSDFLTPALLPPRTPMFRDVNTLTFRQLLRPNQ
jgi:hypothetical protein